MSEHHLSILIHTASVVSALVNRGMPTGDVPAAIKSVYDAFATCEMPTEQVQEPQLPAVNPKKSVYPDYIICLEDGLKFKSLKRHIQTVYGLSPEQYRDKWNLPADYPMVSPNYSEKRSTLAKLSGLGKKK